MSLARTSRQLFAETAPLYFEKKMLPILVVLSTPKAPRDLLDFISHLTIPQTRGIGHISVSLDAPWYSIASDPILDLIPRFPMLKMLDIHAIDRHEVDYLRRKLRPLKVNAWAKWGTKIR